MKPIIVYTLNKESVLVPDYQTYIESMSYSQPTAFYETDGNKPCEVYVENHRWPIIQITKGKANKFGLEPERWDTYIAIEPELEEAVSAKYRERITESIEYSKRCRDELLILENKYSYLENELDLWWANPWYKCVWEVLKFKWNN
jgi:hypothetical protein